MRGRNGWREEVRKTLRERERKHSFLAVPGPCSFQKAHSDYRHSIVLWPRKVGEILDSREDSWIVASGSVVLAGNRLTHDGTTIILG